jgi:hypothetical protein
LTDLGNTTLFLLLLRYLGSVFASPSSFTGDLGYSRLSAMPTASYTVAAVGLGQPKGFTINFPRQVRDGSGGVTANTGQGLIRVTFSVTLLLNRR